MYAPRSPARQRLGTDTPALPLAPLQDDSNNYTPAEQSGERPSHRQSLSTDVNRHISLKQHMASNPDNQGEAGADAPASCSVPGAGFRELQGSLVTNSPILAKMNTKAVVRGSTARPQAAPSHCCIFAPCHLCLRSFSHDLPPRAHALCNMLYLAYRCSNHR